MKLNTVHHAGIAMALLLGASGKATASLISSFETHSSQSDALSTIHFAINLPEGAAPDPTDVPEPAVWSFFLLALYFCRKSLRLS